MNTSRLWRWTALSGFLGLIGWITVWNSLVSPPDSRLVAPLLIVLLSPLLVGLRGMLHRRRYTHGWVGMLALFYFVLGVGDAYADPVDRPYGLVLIALSVMLFAGAIGYIKSGARIKTQGERE